MRLGGAVQDRIGRTISRRLRNSFAYRDWNPSWGSIWWQIKPSVAARVWEQVLYPTRGRILRRVRCRS